MSYNRGYIIIPRAGIYYIYAQLWADPRSSGDSRRTGFDIMVNGDTTVASAIAVKDNQEDHSMYAGVIRLLQRGDRLTVVISHTEYYEFQNANSYFGAFMVRSG